MSQPDMTQPDRRDLAPLLRRIAEHAGQAILEIYQDEIEVRHKADASPVTLADERAEALIMRELHEAVPEIPIVAEEQAAAGRIPDVSGRRFFLVDPLDGTKEFIRRNGEFTVNIALIEDGRPVLGVVHIPVLGLTYWVCGAGHAWRRRGGGPAERIACRPAPDDGLVVVASRSHSDEATDEYLSRLLVKERKPAGSSLKFCRVAEGAADLYPRFGRTMEWDTAAGHAVLAAAGGTVTHVDGTPLDYGKPGFENPAFIARGA